MSEEYIPTTGHVRRNYVYAEGVYSAFPNARVMRQGEFDRWLETVRAEAKAEAWDEGYIAGHEDARAVQPTYPQPTPNPYRKEASDE